VADSVAAGERAAFHGAPAAAVRILERVVAAAEARGARAEVARAGWLLGVTLAAGGRYGTALRVLTPLLTPGPTSEQRLVGGLACATVASVHRQLGRHAVARGHDEAGLALAPGEVTVAFDCQLGLAADAVGLGEPAAAGRWLAAAEASVDAGSWRSPVRLDWVRAEVALLTGDVARAEAAAAAAVERAERARAPRHAAKGRLFLGAAQLTRGARHARVALRRAATAAESLGAWPLVWPARTLLAAAVADDAPLRAASLAAARSAIVTIAADLPAALRDEWLSRPDVAAALAAP
jgi:hypothetical protein